KRCVVERGDIQLSKTQTTWELEYLTNLFFALVVDSAAYVLSFLFRLLMSLRPMLISYYLCLPTCVVLRYVFFYLGNYYRRDPRERSGLAASPITRCNLFGLILYEKGNEELRLRMKVKVHESDMTAKAFHEYAAQF
ncbi:LOW QUALITY PROTEIN: hypothetical protein HID58_088774, partial [Brassica napus]